MTVVTASQMSSRPTIENSGLTLNACATEIGGDVAAHHLPARLAPGVRYRRARPHPGRTGRTGRRGRGRRLPRQAVQPPRLGRPRQRRPSTNSVTLLQKQTIL